MQKSRRPAPKYADLETLTLSGVQKEDDSSEFLVRSGDARRRIGPRGSSIGYRGGGEFSAWRGNKYVNQYFGCNKGVISNYLKEIMERKWFFVGIFDL